LNFRDVDEILDFLIWQRDWLKFSTALGVNGPMVVHGQEGMWQGWIGWPDSNAVEFSISLGKLALLIDREKSEEVLERLCALLCKDDDWSVMSGKEFLQAIESVTNDPLILKALRKVVVEDYLVVCAPFTATVISATRT